MSQRSESKQYWSEIRAGMPFPNMNIYGFAGHISFFKDTHDL